MFPLPRKGSRVAAMLRKSLVALVLLSLLAGWIVWKKRPPVVVPSGTMPIMAEPLVLDSDNPGRTQLGALHFLGAWRLTGPDSGFGGLSSMRIAPDGSIWSLNDTGTMFHFPQPTTRAPMMARAYLLNPPVPPDWRRPFDSESTAVDPAFRHMWVGYEMVQRICRYDARDLRALGVCRDWPEMKDWPPTMSLESMERLPDGRFLVIGEGAPGAGGRGRAGLLFAGDPVSPRTPHPLPFTYIPPTGYNPTDAVYIGGDEMLVLNRRATLYDGFTAIIKRVSLRGLRRGAVLDGPEIARFVPPVLTDNLEGMALERKDGQRILWVVSDDNHLFFQRTLLFKFALPEAF